MNKQNINKIIELSQACLARFWQRDVEYPISFFDKDILWIGSAACQYMEGIEKATEDFRTIKNEIIPCHLLQQSFSVVQNCGNACTIVGKYLTTTDDDTGCFLQVQQRATFTWEMSDGKYKIKHIHISNPLGELSLAEGERIPNALGSMSKKYFMYRLSSVQDKERIIAVDKNDVTHFLTRSEILYATANKRNCDIHTTQGKVIHARMSITDFQDVSGDDFSSVHRSYIVNNNYISHIQPYEVVLADDTAIPVPVKKYTEVREYLAARYDIEIGKK